MASGNLLLPALASSIALGALKIVLKRIRKVSTVDRKEEKVELKEVKEIKKENYQPFDSKLLREWEARKQFFRTQYSDFERRRIGPYVLQYSPEHSSKKRKTTSNLPSGEGPPVLQPFEYKGFNFTKVKEQEVIAYVRTKTYGGVSLFWGAKDIQVKMAIDPTKLMINVSPLAPGHCVLAIRPTQFLKQAITAGALELGVEMVSDSIRRDFRVVYNSMGAWASQNHLHLHTIYTKNLGFENDLLALEQAFENASSKSHLQIFPHQITLSRGYPIPSFRFHHTPGERSAMISRAHAFIRSLQENNVPHNVVIAPSRLNNVEGSEVQQRTIVKMKEKGTEKWENSEKYRKNLSCVVYVIPRKNQIFNSRPICAGIPLKFAVVEAAGLVLARSREQFESLTLEDIETEMRTGVALAENELKTLIKLLPS